jgi:DNA-directed RNA polymerase specialized sigma24 family protein
MPHAAESGIEELFRARYLEMVRLAGLLGADDPEDIAQEAFARLIRRHDSLRDPAAALAYVRTSVARVVIRLDHGYQREVSAFRPAWPGSGVRFFAVALPRSLFPRLPQDPSPRGTVTAYDAAGRVLATEPMIGTGP